MDSALLRKGRLIAKYEFKELEIDKARVLSKKLGYNSFLNTSMTLTDIYNQSDKEFNQLKREPIGFKLPSEKKELPEDYLAKIDLKRFVKISEKISSE